MVSSKLVTCSIPVNHITATGKNQNRTVLNEVKIRFLNDVL